MKKLVKVLMMMALVFGAASCSDEKDMPVMPTTPESEQEGMTKTEEPEYPRNVKILLEEASKYDNITVINNATLLSDVKLGGAPMIFDLSSFEGFDVVIYIADTSFYYDVYVPSEGAKLGLKYGKEDSYIGLSEVMYLNKDITELPFKKELLGLRYDCDDKRHNHGNTERDYYYKSFNDYIVGVFDSPQVLQLEILPNQSGDEQILSFGVSDGFPQACAGMNIIQAAK